MPCGQSHHVAQSSHEGLLENLARSSAAAPEKTPLVQPLSPNQFLEQMIFNHQILLLLSIK